MKSSFRTIYVNHMQAFERHIVYTASTYQTAKIIPKMIGKEPFKYYVSSLGVEVQKPLNHSDVIFERPLKVLVPIRVIGIIEF